MGHPGALGPPRRSWLLGIIHVPKLVNCFQYVHCFIQIKLRMSRLPHKTALLRLCANVLCGEVRKGWHPGYVLTSLNQWLHSRQCSDGETEARRGERTCPVSRGAGVHRLDHCSSAILLGGLTVKGEKGLWGRQVAKSGLSLPLVLTGATVWHRGAPGALSLQVLGLQLLQLMQLSLQPLPVRPPQLPQLLHRERVHVVEGDGHQLPGGRAQLAQSQCPTASAFTGPSRAPCHSFCPCG